MNICLVVNEMSYCDLGSLANLLKNVTFFEILGYIMYIVLAYYTIRGGRIAIKGDKKNKKENENCSCHKSSNVERKKTKIIAKRTTKTSELPDGYKNTETTEEVEIEKEE